MSALEVRIYDAKPISPRLSNEPRKARRSLSPGAASRAHDWCRWFARGPVASRPTPWRCGMLPRTSMRPILASRPCSRATSDAPSFDPKPPASTVEPARIDGRQPIACGRTPRVGSTSPTNADRLTPSPMTLLATTGPSPAGRCTYCAPQSASSSPSMARRTIRRRWGKPVREARRALSEAAAALPRRNFASRVRFASVHASYCSVGQKREPMAGRVQQELGNPSGSWHG